jgi:hypothetical protein
MRPVVDTPIALSQLAAEFGLQNIGTTNLQLVIHPHDFEL